MAKRTRSGPAGRHVYLLDTSTLLWAAGAPERLSAAARRALESGDNIVSVASYWEVVIKSQKGLLTITDLPTWWRRATELVAARVLPIRPSHITSLAALPPLHKDPFDRLLIGQAIAEGLDLITNDQAMRAYPVRIVW